MASAKFTIGKAFPASDPVARFITVLAMMSNDWARLSKQQVGIEYFHDDAEGLRLFYFRQQASLHFESAKFIRNARRLFPSIDAFVNALPARARRDCDRVLAGMDPKSKRYQGKWVEDLRNTSFHYPTMHPKAFRNNREPAATALAKAAKLKSSIESGDFFFGEARFHFADEVMVQWIPRRGMKGRIKRLGEESASLARFVQAAAKRYIDEMERAKPKTFKFEP
jgi:hypothetical protein